MIYLPILGHGIVYCPKCGVVSVPEKDLPVLLPDDVEFRPTGESPLKFAKDFYLKQGYKINKTHLWKIGNTKTKTYEMEKKLK